MLKKSLLIATLGAITLAIPKISYCAAASSSCAEDQTPLHSKVQPFFEISYTLHNERCKISFCIQKQLAEQAKRCIHRAMIDVCSTKNRSGNQLLSEPSIQYRELESSTAPKTSKDQEDPEYESFRKKLIALSGIENKLIRVTVRSPSTTSLNYELVWKKAMPDDFERNLFRTTIGLESQKDTPIVNKITILTLALARALLHNNIYAIHYLLPECNPHENLSPYIFAQFFAYDYERKQEVEKAGPKGVPTLLHVCMLAPKALYWGFRHEKGKKIITGLGLPDSLRLVIKALISRGADPTIKDSEGMRPIDIFNQRLVSLKQHPKFKDVSVDYDESLMALTTSYSCAASSSSSSFI